MTKLDDTTRLKHLRDAAQETIAFMAGQTKQDLENNRLLLLAVVKDIEIIGEAASKLSDACRDQCPQLPWRDIIGMRNRLVHAYFEIDVDVVWEVVTTDLPKLLPAVESLLTPEA
ncbi:MAG: DUF86 domain-containing protein [Cyanobacteria bacterium J06635_15]